MPSLSCEDNVSYIKIVCSGKIKGLITVSEIINFKNPIASGDYTLVAHFRVPYVAPNTCRHIHVRIHQS